MTNSKINTWLQKPYIAGFVYGVVLFGIYLAIMGMLLGRAPSGGLDSLGVAIMYAAAVVEVGPVAAVLLGALLCSIVLMQLKVKRWYIHGIFASVVSLYGALLVQDLALLSLTAFNMMMLSLVCGALGAVSFCVVYLVRNIHIALAIFVLAAIASAVFVASYSKPGVIGDTVEFNKIASRESASPRDVYIPPTDSRWTQAGYLSRSYDDEYTVTSPMSEDRPDFISIHHVPIHKVITRPAVRDGRCVRVVEKKYYDSSRPVEQSTLDYVCELIHDSDEVSIYLERLVADHPFHPGGGRTYYSVMPDEILLKVSPRQNTEDDSRMVDFIRSLRLATLEEKTQLVKNQDDR